jgi:hypothetical protein
VYPTFGGKHSNGPGTCEQHAGGCVVYNLQDAVLVRCTSDTFTCECDIFTICLAY